MEKLHRRLAKLICTSAIGAFLTVVPAYADKAVGVNVNGLGDQLEDLSVNGMLARSGTVWVRMFVDMSKLRGKSQTEISNDESISNFNALHSQGYKTILNLKWATNGRDFPGPNTQGRLDDFDVMRKVLIGAGAANIDIVVVGNEPFRETDGAFRDQDMTDWYERMASEINNFRNNNNYNYDIYMGSFNNVYKTSERTTVLADLMQFAKNKSWIAGIDLHTHHEMIEEWQETLNYAKNQIRNDQDIIVTEFSLMRWYKSKNSNNLSNSYKSKYYPNGTSNKVWQELVQLQNVQETNRWYDFNAMHGFVSSRKHYLRNVHRDYFNLSANRVRVATFALRQNPFPNYSSNSDAWIYNGLFCFSTCSGEDDSYQWLADFNGLPKQ
ncbi:hypothetical protein DXV75_03185 [Alteromonas aestuariivivens]|uniref:Glycoside hydrolase family 5 domain-containing protein n=1 Tax=Alteromonas aestuariivivens TaxID=1938339 RepID=A0A3D8MDQ2_9ALTE|nr:hypothetical protein [Alteromonas aestuariivivens]RDV27987.1 hypothetical protein DXV75_03185 [Alteromonas aestuariivivens]